MNCCSKYLYAVTLFVLVVSCVQFISTPSNATEPAVSGLNGKISAEGGSFDTDGDLLPSDEEYLVKGSITAPISHSFGFQLDGALGERSQETLFGGGLHLFHRDPSRYLIGFYGSAHDLEDISIWRASIEVEYYWQQFSMEGIMGYQHLDLPSRVNGIPLLPTDEGNFFTNIDFGYYATDNLRFTGGYRYENELSIGSLEVEYAVPSSRGFYSIFASGRVGENDYDRIVGGIRFYFGQDNIKSLKARHREDDPKNWVPDIPLDVQLEQLSDPAPEPEPEPD